VAAGRNPRDVKVMLAQELVARFHTRSAADDALQEFEARFSRGVLPADMPEFTVQAAGEISLVQVLKQTGLTGSTSEALRMIEQGAVRADGERVADKSLVFVPGAELVLQVGKRRFGRIRVC
jgi:tyrosyl-tRNA synthetase